MKISELETERLVLKSPTVKDALNYSKAEVSYYSTGKINTEEKAKNYIRKKLRDKNSFEVGMFLKSNGKLIGILEIDHMHWFDFEAGELTSHIKKKYTRMGYGTEAARELIKYCFSKMKFHKMYADTDSDNIAGQKSLEKLGFKLEGVIREKHKKKGKRFDELDYGLFEKELK